MGQKLGEPDGEGLYDGSSRSWSRSFGGGAAKGGASVTFNAATNKGTVQWAK